MRGENVPSSKAWKATRHRAGDDEENRLAGAYGAFFAKANRRQ